MAEEIGREATSLAAQTLHGVAPIIAIEEDAVHEQRRVPFAPLCIGDLSDARRHALLLLCHDGPFRYEGVDTLAD
jgi:hypothetical protein